MMFMASIIDQATEKQMMLSINIIYLSTLKRYILEIQTPVLSMRVIAGVQRMERNNCQMALLKQKRVTESLKNFHN